MTISSLLVALIRIMCTALPSSTAKLVLDGKDYFVIFKQSYNSQDTNKTDGLTVTLQFETTFLHGISEN